jgi:hypothetical protein
MHERQGRSGRASERFVSDFAAGFEENLETGLLRAPICVMTQSFLAPGVDSKRQGESASRRKVGSWSPQGPSNDFEMGFLWGGITQVDALG